MTNKKFKYVGITVQNGNAKARFTDDMIRRVKIFSKTGSTRCDFVELPSEMTKIEALQYALTQPQFASPSDQATLNDGLADRQKELRKGEVKVKATKAKPSLENIKSRAKKAVVGTKEDIKSA